MGDQRSVVAVVAREIEVPKMRKCGKAGKNVAKSMNKVFE